MTRPQDEATRRVVHSERPIYQSRWVSVGLADIPQPSGDRFDHHTVTLPPAAMAVVLDDAGENVLLSWRHRFVPDVSNWELPAGLIEEGESAEDAAVREIAEETGYRPRSIEHLVTSEGMIGTARSPLHVFLARGAEHVAEATESNEGTFEWVSLADVPELIAKGRIVSSGSLVGLLHVLALSGPGASHAQ
jgi:8-oxo-dGTP pyrophosphatase MutT (NUDIX family)